MNAAQVHLPVIQDGGFAAEEPPSREQLRSRRKRQVRSKTVSMSRFRKRDLAIGRLLFPPSEDDPPRPEVRADCASVPRPCPYISCRHHLYLDVSPTTGAIKLNFPDLEPGELEESCSLDMADQGPRTLEQAGALMNVTRERMRQLEVLLFERIRREHPALVREISSLWNEGR